MNNNLLIAGAGTYGLVTREIALDMKCFDKIAFIDDSATQAPDGSEVIGTFSDIQKLSKEYSNIIIAVGNPDIRENLSDFIENNVDINLTTLISPKAYISPLAKIEKGSIIEPMAVVHVGCNVGKCCIVSAGAVINHMSTCHDFCHIDCNATIGGYTTVPKKSKVECGSIFKNVFNTK